MTTKKRFFECEACGDVEDIEDIFHVDEFEVCYSCQESYDTCPHCGRLIRKDNIVETRPKTLEEPAEYGCNHCHTPRYGSREWKQRRAEETCDEKYDAWKDEGKPGGRYR